MINDPRHIETSQLICIENQLTGFYMTGNMVINGLMIHYSSHLTIE